MIRFIVLLMLSVLLGFGKGTALGQTPLPLQAKNALALVETSAGVGSGFAVAPNVVATACHVVKGAAAIQLHFWAAKVKVAARQTLCDEKRDIAFLSTTVPEGTAVLEFMPVKPAQGEQIWVWGYPLGTAIALEPSVSIGIVSATETAEGFIALDVSGAPGNSGGPVVNAQGKVIGIFVASWSAGRQGATGFKYAAPATVALSLLTTGVATAPGTPRTQPSAATVRPGEAVGAVKLGMTPAQAQEAIGLPPTERFPSGWYNWATRKLWVLFENGRAYLIDTEDPADSTPEGIRVGSTDIDLIKAYGPPVCSSVRDYRGKAYLGWYYEGLFLFLDKTPRQVFAIRVLPGGLAADLCK